MKKSLLLASMAVLTVASASAVAKDNSTYEPYNGINCKNIWIMDRGHDLANYTASPIGQTYAKYRTATLTDGVIYVGGSENWDPTAVDDKGNKLDCAGFQKYDMLTGEYLGQLKVTFNGKPITGLLTGNSVGVDSFGHLWVAPYIASQASHYKVYSVDPATGVATLQAELPLTINGRIDYCDVIGDITRQQANSTIMAAAAPPAEGAVTYRWMSEKGSTDSSTGWFGGWAGDDDSFVFPLGSLYPDKETAWSFAPVVKIVPGEGDTAYDGELFYVDGFTTVPTLYDSNATRLDGFYNAPDCTPESAGANGVAEFSIGDRDFIVYVNNQHTGKNGGNEIWVAELGAGQAFTGMKQVWRLPHDGMNPALTSDGGTRVHSIDREIKVDKNGKVGVYLTTFKCNAGIGTYLISEDGFEGAGVAGTEIAADATINVANGVITVSEEASEIAIFNIAGQLVNKVNNATEVAAPAAGAYIVKALVNGNSIVKKVVL